MNSLEMLKSMKPGNVRYIKLGAGGGWEQAAFGQGRLYWGGQADPVEIAPAPDWAAIRAHYDAMRLRPSTATGYVRELRDFCSGPAEVLWITFARGHLWWAFARGAVQRNEPLQGQGAFYRDTVDGWHNTDISGRPLVMADLSTSLTKVSAYQQSICSIGAAEYLLRTLRAEPDVTVAAAIVARERFASAMLPLIQQLHQDDFELFTDLLFTAMGWRRVSMLGGTMKDIDLLVELPATGERASVQVKSAASQRVLDASVAAFGTGGVGGSLYFVCHSAPRALKAPEGAQVRLLTGKDLSDAAVRHGMADWLLQRAA